ncbi:GAF domain-containing protein [Hymenobacter busanensis]|uniref:GAF domain-containing protein n=1 Tax=Hymenobacter busanensis TaxID=2607656 RepID=A0A7L4ZWE7_9BACT|nr:GAF domain-containing DNA-binding protein [Hymenobacter busanensis]KAA9325535.1 GAF domain-containing protein [Hymenobacter busanensis]QHJ07794.1 GAF domain-containing protein [Hymenobacter busanensis]
MPTRATIPPPALAKADSRYSTEEERLEALRAYQILDTAPDEDFDALTRLAAYICGTPISLVSLIDTSRQWFKANFGLDGISETPREYSFCQYAMVADGVYEVDDVESNPMFRNNPLVTGNPNIRFYAGAPLVTPSGQPLGALCAIDTKPRHLTAAQRDALQTLAREVVSHLELRRARLQLEQEQQKLDGLMRMANDAAQTLYSGGRSEIFVKQEHKLVRINTADIRYVEALGDYVNIYAAQERFTVYTTMKDMLVRLAGRDFVRVHRKYIVRLDRIVAIEGDSVMIDNSRTGADAGRSVAVPIGNSYKGDLMGQLNLV